MPRVSQVKTPWQSVRTCSSVRGVQVLVLVLAVGQQRHVAHPIVVRLEQFARQVEPGSDGGAAAARAEPADRLPGRGAGVLVRHGQRAARGVDHPRRVGPADHGEQHAVRQQADRGRGGLLGQVVLGDRAAHRTRPVDQDDLREPGARPGAGPGVGGRAGPGFAGAHGDGDVHRPPVPMLLGLDLDRQCEAQFPVHTAIPMTRGPTVQVTDQCRRFTRSSPAVSSRSADFHRTVRGLIAFARSISTVK
jgi:hypothetical protein